MEKQYFLNDFQVHVAFADGIIRITNNRALKLAIQAHPEKSVDLLVRSIQEDYLLHNNKMLLVTSDSLVVEIWGHIYFEYFLLRYNKLLQFILIFGLYGRFRKSCEVIDCGELGKDPNRRLWDVLTPYRRTIAKRLPNVDLLRFSRR